MSQSRLSITRIDEDGNLDDPFNDKICRDRGKIVLPQLIGNEYVNGTQKGIDLIEVGREECGAEGEDGSWDGNKEDSNQQDIFKLGFATAQIEDRKWHYWNLQHLQY